MKVTQFYCVSYCNEGYTVFFLSSTASLQSLSAFSASEIQLLIPGMEMEIFVGSDVFLGTCYEY